MVHLASLTSLDLTFAGENLDNAPIVEFTTMIKALLALKYLREVEPPKEGAQPGEPSGQESFQSARKFSAEQYDFLVDRAIEFCKDPHRSIDLKGAFQIQEAVSSVSKPLRRQRVVRGRKSILSHFRETPIGYLEVHDFAFVANGSPDLVDLSPSKDFSRGAELRPDIIDLAFELLQKWTLESTPWVLEQEAFEHDRITWADITYCCKLGIPKVLERECLTRSNEKFNVEDLDLAAIMTPVQASPTKQGYERTGTKPFMPLMLLGAEPGDVIQRRWSHELEFIIWCLAWYVLLGIVDWQEGTYRQVGHLKREWLGRARPKQPPKDYRPGTEHLWAPLVASAHKWNHRQEEVDNGYLEYSDKANMELIHSFLPHPKRPDREEWDWMDFKVKEEDIREGDRVFVETE